MVGKARFPLGTRTAVNQTQLHAASLGTSFPVLSQFLPCSLLPDTSTRSSDSRAGKGGLPALECRLQGLGAPDAVSILPDKEPGIFSIATQSALHLPVLLRQTVLSCSRTHHGCPEPCPLQSTPCADAGGSPRASLLPVSSPVF